VLSQTQVSAVACDENIPQRQNPKFTVKRNLDEEEEGRTIASTRWKIKGINLNSTKVVPIKIPLSIGSSSPANSMTRSLSTPTEGEYKGTSDTATAATAKGFHRYHGSSPSQHSPSSTLVSSSVQCHEKSQWQHARVQGSSSGDPHLSLAQLPLNTKPIAMPMPMAKTRACSDSSDEYHGESDQDFEIEGRTRGGRAREGARGRGGRRGETGGAGRTEEEEEEEGEEEEEEDCDDDSSVKVEIGGFPSQKRQHSKSRQQAHTTTATSAGARATASSSSSSSRRRNNHRSVDLGNITLDCE
jgi:hypothetical protein